MLYNRLARPLTRAMHWGSTAPVTSISVATMSRVPSRMLSKCCHRFEHITDVGTHESSCVSVSYAKALSFNHNFSTRRRA